MSASKLKSIESMLRYQWERSVIGRNEATTQNVRNYYQGCIDTCNEMLCCLGYSRLDQSDEIMAVQSDRIGNRVRMIQSDKWLNIPSSVYN